MQWKIKNSNLKNYLNIKKFFSYFKNIYKNINQQPLTSFNPFVLKE